MLRSLKLFAIILTVSLTFAAAQVPKLPKSTAKPSASERKEIAEGSRLYQHYCASCHGIDGRGSGPVTPALRTVPPDLTRIEKKAGAFPAEELQKAIAGRNGVSVHGTSEMPVWGTVLPKKEIASIVKYLESIQRLM